MLFDHWKGVFFLSFFARSPSGMSEHNVSCGTALLKGTEAGWMLSSLVSSFDHKDTPWLHRSSAIKDLKRPLELLHHQCHHHWLSSPSALRLSPSSSGWLSKHQSSLQQKLVIALLPSSTLCFLFPPSPQTAFFLPSSLFSLPPPPPPLPLQILRASAREEGHFIIIIIINNTVIVAITVVVFTSLPPAETRTSNTPQVHYSSHSIISLTVNHAVDHT